MTGRAAGAMMRRMFGRVLMVGLLLALSACSSGGEAFAPVTLSAVEPLAVADGLGVYRETAGTAEVRRAHAPYWEPLENEAIVRVGDWVRTGPGGGVRLDFFNGSKLEVEERAVVVVEAPEDQPAGAPKAPSVAISQGVVRGVSGDEASEAPAAPLVLRAGGRTQRVVASKGQKQFGFRLRATEAGTEIAVTEGSATVEQDGQSVELSKGNATVASATLSAAVEVPDFPVSVTPGIDARAVYPLRAPLFLTWKAVPRATGYRVQVARDLNFSVEVKSNDVQGTSFEVKPEGRGLLVWRVATLGAGGMVSEFGFARRIYFEADAPRELLLTPEDNETIGFHAQPPSVAFQWQAAAGATSYRLSISRTGDPLRKPVVTETTQEQRFEVKSLPAGEYTWGVYLRPGLTPIFLAPRHLTVKAMAKPKVDVPKTIKW